MKYRACHHSTAGYGTRWCLVFDSCPLPSSMNSHISRGALESLGTPSVRVVMLMIIATQHSNSDIAIRAKKLAELLNSLPPLLSPQGTAARRIQRWVESAGKYRQGVECYVPHPPQCTSDKKKHSCLIDTLQHSGVGCGFNAAGKCLPLLSRENAPVLMFTQSNYLSTNRCFISFNKRSNGS